MPGAWRQIWREDLLRSFIEMASSRFVNVSNEDISEFLKENENNNTATRTSQDVACEDSLVCDIVLKTRE